MTEPNKALLDEGLPTLILDGKHWPVPMLAPKQNRTVVPLLLYIVPKITASYTTIMVKDDDGIEYPKSVADLEKLSEVLTEKNIDSITRAIYHGLKRGHPDITLEEVENMPIGTFEMIDAILILAKQTGVLRAPREGEKQKGEAIAA